MPSQEVLETASKQEPVEVTKGSEKGTLKVNMTVREYNPTFYDSCKKFEVKIQQQLEGVAKFTEIG